MTHAPKTGAIKRLHFFLAPISGMREAYKLRTGFF